jgi:hypothetical protein
MGLDEASFIASSRTVCLATLAVVWRIELILFRHLATLGAILPIIGIITSPITQQTIQYPLRRAETEGTSFVNAVKQYKSDEDFMGYGTGPLLAESSAGLTAAHGVEIVKPIAPICSTEECSYQRFKTLGICANVKNVTSALNVTRVENLKPLLDTTTVQKAFMKKYDGKIDLTRGYNVSLNNVDKNCWAVNP